MYKLALVFVSISVATASPAIGLGLGGYGVASTGINGVSGVAGAIGVGSVTGSVGVAASPVAIAASPVLATAPVVAAAPAVAAAPTYTVPTATSSQSRVDIINPRPLVTQTVSSVPVNVVSGYSLGYLGGIAAGYGGTTGNVGAIGVSGNALAGSGIVSSNGYGNYGAGYSIRGY